MSAPGDVEKYKTPVWMMRPKSEKKISFIVHSLRNYNSACMIKAYLLALPSLYVCRPFAPLSVFKEMLQTPENSPRARLRKTSDMTGIDLIILIETGS